ncbi:MAG: DNA-binding NarL/FixJ family response regulator [Mariniblastus sp.]|jgi:DNA-binding NarL/FixJ family response regulator
MILVILLLLNKSVIPANLAQREWSLSVFRLPEDPSGRNDELRETRSRRGEPRGNLITKNWSMPLNIVVAEDHPVVREGICKVAKESGMEVIGYADSPDKIVESVSLLQPAVLVTEVRLGGHDALKTLEKLDLKGHECGVVVFTSFMNPTNIARASALGCHDFIFKTSGMDVLMAAIQNAAAGHATPESSLLVKTKTRMRRSSSSENDSPLTNRESQVLRHVAMGLSNREIGKSLGISVETVKEHVQNILRKLDVNDRTQAAVWALKNSLI